MKVFITGATGFLGGALARSLAADHHTVIALSRTGSARSLLAEVPIAWQTGDVTRPATLDGLFDGVDAVIHAAGRLGEAGVSEADYRRLHVDGTRHVLEAAGKAKVGRVLHLSSPGVLGPIDGPPADETAPYAPSNPYERSKAAAERVAVKLAAEGVPVVIARPEFVYGPGDHHVLGLFNAVRRGLFFYVGDGQATCHPTYIADAVDGLKRSLWAGLPGEIYHLTGPRPVTFRELGQALAAALDVAPPRLAIPYPLAWAGAAGLELLGRLLRRPPPLSRTGVAFFSENRRFSWEKAHRQLGYSPGVDIVEGAARTVAWYRQHGWLPAAEG